MEIPEGKKEKIVDCLQAILAEFNLEDYHFVLSIVEFKPKKPIIHCEVLTNVNEENLISLFINLAKSFERKTYSKLPNNEENDA